MTGKIIFENSAYPQGHAIKEFKWFGTKQPDGSVFFQLRLVTEDYSQSQAVTNQEDSDWTSKIVWDNYSHCILSTVDWNNSGFKVAASLDDFSPDDIKDATYEVDTLQLDPEDNLPLEDDDPEEHNIGIYLLGHDSCANHKIQFTKNQNGLFDIEWHGDIALAYAGEDDYSYHFTASISDVPFLGLVDSAEAAKFAFSQNEG